MRRSLLLGPKIVPTEPVEIDWSHPLAQGLQFLLLPAAGAVGNRDLIDGLSSSSVSAPIGLGGRGPGMLTTATGTGWQFNSSPPGNLRLNVGGTLFWTGLTHGTPIGGYNSAGVIGLVNSTVGWESYALQASAYTRSYLFDYISGTSTQRVEDSGGVPPVGEHSAAVSFVVGGNIGMYRDGILSGSATWVGTTAPSYSSNSYLSVASDGNGARVINGTTYITTIYGRALSADLIAWLAAEPFAMLRPKMRQRWYAASITPPPPPSLRPDRIAAARLRARIAAAAADRRTAAARPRIRTAAAAPRE